jgi:Mlc titration factor MtfA (ptsG expression regulator)
MSEGVLDRRRALVADLPPALDRGRLAFALVVGGLVAVFPLVGGGPWWLPAFLGPAVALPLYLPLTRRGRRRRRLAMTPFPEGWRATLEDYVAFYRDLDPVGRARFEARVRWFLDEQRIVGPKGAEVEDELRVLAAASAIVLTFGRPRYAYPTQRDILIYEGSFDDDYQEGGNILGVVHAQGPVILSARSLRGGFRGAHDGRNVGYHEFAHVLDFEGGPADGVPSVMPWAAVRPWVALMREEAVRIEEGDSVLRRYALENEAEFFAVATEAFFERPRRLAGRHPELYALLRATYGQDPAADG